jgi:hypothetical protein
MIASKVIETVDRLKPNTFEDEDKFRWINELEGMVQKLVLQSETIKELTYPEDLSKTLIIEAPFDNLYEMYVSTQIDLYDKNYDEYNNSAEIFEQQFTEYKKAYIRKHKAKY